MEGNIYKLKEYVYSNNYKHDAFYIIESINHFIDTYTVVEVFTDKPETRQLDIPYIELKQLFQLEFDAFMNSWKFKPQTLEYKGIYSGDLLPWTNMINNKLGTQCFHKWTKYVGFIEQYEFCEKCNEKKFNNE